MRKLTNKLFISILTVAFAVIALGTTTFAWFTLSNTATISPFNATVTSGEGIEVSLDEDAWYTTIPTSVINAYLFDVTEGTHGSNFKLSAVTTADGTTFNKIKNDNSALEAAVAEADYIEFTLNFRSSAESAPSIFWNGVTLTSNGVQWTSDASFTDAKGPVAMGDTSTRFAANATRILVDGTTDIIYELAANENAQAEDELIPFSYQPGNSVLSNTAVSTLPNGARNYFLVKRGVEPFGYDTATASATITDLLANNDTAIITLTAGTGGASAWVGSIVVRVWIEGWDQDSFNAILKDTLTIGLVFGTTAA
ncbi:MAG: hypothetical protein AB7T03_04620 [Bacilli bacterium]